jgi:hypothetical protein
LEIISSGITLLNGLGGSLLFDRVNDCVNDPTLIDFEFVGKLLDTVDGGSMFTFGKDSELNKLEISFFDNTPFDLVCDNPIGFNKDSSMLDEL